MPLLYILTCISQYKKLQTWTQTYSLLYTKKDLFQWKNLFWVQWHIYIRGETTPPVIRVPKNDPGQSARNCLFNVKHQSTVFHTDCFYCDTTCLRHPCKGRNKEMDLFGWRSLTGHGWWVLQFRKKLSKTTGLKILAVYLLSKQTSLKCQIQVTGKYKHTCNAATNKAIFNRGINVPILLSTPVHSKQPSSKSFIFTAVEMH